MYIQKYHNKKFINNDYNFEDVLKLWYKKKFPKFDRFENSHLLLEDGSLAADELKYYNENVRLFGINDRNSIFIKEFYNFIDTDYTFLSLYIDFLKNKIKSLFPNEEYLVVQKTPNIRFHFPGYSNIGKLDTDPSDEIIGVHKDRQFNHPDSELNIILPITDMFETNSIYYEQFEKSNEKLEDFKSMTLKKKEFLIVYLNNCMHYNKINNTDQTRVSFDFRILPYSKYKHIDKKKLSATSNNKFKLGDYYMLI